MDYKNMKLENIINWCKENNQVDWLKEIINTPIPVKDDEGEYLDNRDITFIELKKAFVEKFMPEIKPIKNVKPTMKEIINAL